MAVNNNLYTAFSPIFLRGNSADFTNFPTDGTSTDPFIISTALYDIPGVTAGGSVIVNYDSVWNISVTIFISDTGDANNAILEVSAEPIIYGGPASFILDQSSILVPGTLCLSGSANIAVVASSAISISLTLSGGTLNNAILAGFVVADQYQTFYGGHLVNPI